MENPGKQKKYNYFIGIDVSKNTLDYAVMHQSKVLFHRQDKNELADIGSFIIGLKALPKFTIPKALFCMEHTGIYCNHLLNVLKKFKANVVLENPLLIRSFLGLKRGKTDKADAIRIASYAQKNKDDLNLWICERPVLQYMTSIYALRNRLLTIAVALKMPLEEQKTFIKQGLQKQNMQLCNRSMASIDADLLEIDLQIDLLINADGHLKRLMELITSVPGVGRITAIRIIISTNEFRDINDPKKFACYAGVAPFAKSSGLVKRKAKVSNFANKRMKSLLHLCAISASRFDNEIKAYYARKTQVEGKPKLVVINAIRYKLILRIFACVNQNRTFAKNYAQTKELQQVD